MIYAMLYNRETEKTETRIFYSYTELFSYTFAPVWDSVIIDTDKPPKGQDYYDKQNTLRDLAIDYSHSWCADHVDGISWGECAELDDYFTKYGKRYGLLKEFHENCII